MQKHLLTDELASAQRQTEPLRAQLPTLKSALVAARTNGTQRRRKRSLRRRLALRRARAQHDLSTDKDALRKAEAADAAAAAVALAAAEAIPVDDAAIMALRQGVTRLRRGQGAARCGGDGGAILARSRTAHLRRSSGRFAAGQPLRLSAETTAASRRLRLRSSSARAARTCVSGNRRQATLQSRSTVSSSHWASPIRRPARRPMRGARVLLADAEAERRAVCHMRGFAASKLCGRRWRRRRRNWRRCRDAAASTPLALDRPQAAVEAARIEQENAIHALTACQENRDALRPCLGRRAERALITLRVRHGEAAKQGRSGRRRWPLLGLRSPMRRC